MTLRQNTILPSFINHGNLSLTKRKTRQQIEDTLRNVNLYFAASVGREGSNFISSAIAGNEKHICKHEARPFCNGRPLIVRSFRHEVTWDPLIELKWSNIAARVERSSANAYFESNHMFLKTFGWALVDQLSLNFNLICIRRPLLLTTVSFCELGWFSNHYNRASNWIYKIDEHSNLSRSKISLSTEVDEILAYILSEKLNEAQFISRAKANLCAIHVVKIPPEPSELEALSHTFNPYGKPPTVVERNERTDVKVKVADTRQVEVQIFDFLSRNSSYLESMGFSVDLEGANISLGSHNWNIK